MDEGFGMWMRDSGFGMSCGCEIHIVDEGCGRVE